MKTIFLTAFSLLFVVACNAQPGGMAAASKTAHEKPRPVIAVNGSEIRINGTQVLLGDTMEEWKRVIGGSPVCYDAGLIVTCVWHSNGLSLGTDHLDKTRVTFMNLHITIEPPELGERAPSWPKDSFHGTLELDGVPIRPDTIFRDLRRQVPPARQLRCGGFDCGNPSAAFNDGASIDMNLASRSESSRILHFSVSCISTKACVALLPSERRKQTAQQQ